jgi:hypothetical protein
VGGAVVAAAESAAPEPAALPCALAVNVRLPSFVGVHVKPNDTVEPAAMATETGVAAVHLAAAVPDTAVTDGVTIISIAASPPAGALFRTCAVSLTPCPTTTREGGWAAKFTIRAAGARMRTVDEVMLVVCGTSGKLGSTQVANPEMESNCGVAGAVQPDQTRECVAGMLFTGSLGATAHDAA